MTITLRNLPRQVEKAIREKAKEEGLSLNRTVANLLAEATGQGTTKRKRTRYRDLDKFAGLWSKKEADEFDAYLKKMRQVDPEDWK